MHLGADDLPTDLAFDGLRLVAVRQFPGGNVSAQDLGPYDQSISFGGTLRYGDALQRAIALDALRIKGGPITMQTLGGITRTVVVTAFKFTPANAYRVKYTITLQPVDIPGMYTNTTVLTQADGSQLTISVGPTTNYTNAGSGGVGSGSGSGSGSSSSSGSGSGSGSTSSTPKSQFTVYIVHPGDTLIGIASKQLGDGSRWQEIYQDNHLTTTVLQINQILKLPQASAGKTPAQRNAPATSARLGRYTATA